ncbi:DUF1045 domain-containing protein [Celeribacter indicus]|uniref:Phosphonate metabolism protein n=1 Tax=Celeribacter indicus TaxID=1208324 RepID=A0A0B5DZ78_9RHOB|nr:DUF1045 domain-containing protein [Celeribacter indicus]AJE45532.1 hypothetical protein P73_0817 [Celeribacter indicus]SDW86645.1 putative phosphonate metabolism protein [Celeribacter indicus]
MDEFKRYAIYYAPRPGGFAEFCADWLGWDPFEGVPRVHPAVDGLPRPIPEITEAPRKYGFHGTIKPPFRLTGSRAELTADLEAFCASRAPVEMPGLRLSRLGGFLALVPEGDTAALSDLAGAAVATLDPHRAQPGETELARRRAAGLTPQQDAYLVQWGYPYVMEEFRFHLTLTGNLPQEEAEAVRAALAPHLAPLLPVPFRIEDLCLFGEAEDGRFHLLHRYTLSG